jgi:hypothetical protein
MLDGKIAPMYNMYHSAGQRQAPFRFFSSFCFDSNSARAQPIFLVAAHQGVFLFQPLGSRGIYGIGLDHCGYGLEMGPLTGYGYFLITPLQNMLSPCPWLLSMYLSGLFVLLVGAWIRYLGL